MNEWISVKERLPEVHASGDYSESDYVLVFIKDTNGFKISVATYEIDNPGRPGLWVGFSDMYAGDIEGEVTHWMSLPKPPKDVF